MSVLRSTKRRELKLGSEVFGLCDNWFMSRISINELWHSEDEAEWASALGIYWHFVKPHLLQIERELDVLDVQTIQDMDERQWYEFLLENYFRWKYTNAFLYAMSTKHLKTYPEDELPELYQIKQDLLAFDKTDARKGLKIASSIRGLGTAGASGLLGVMFPKHFGTVDQFVVKALREVENLADKAKLKRMNPESLEIGEGVTLIHIMRNKADELNHKFQTDTWTTRKLDMILWTYGGEEREKQQSDMDRFVWKEGDIEIIKP